MYTEQQLERLKAECQEKKRVSVERFGFPVGARVRVTAGCRAGRTGVVHRVCVTAAPTRVVLFDKRPRERKVRREFERIEDLELLQPEAAHAA